MLLQELKELAGEYRTFIRENRWVPWIAVAAVLLSYGICLNGFRIGIDSEAILNDPKSLLDSWYSIGRYSLVFTKDLLGMRHFNPATENLLMMAFMVFYGIFADFLFWVFSGGSRKLKIFYAVFPALFLTHPCFVQQYLFTLQAFEVALGVLLTLMAVYCVSRWAFGGHKWLLAPGIFLTVWGFGSYQALVPFYMAAALAVYLIYYEFHEEQPAFYRRAAIRHLLIFFVSFLLYELAVKAVIVLQNGFGFVGDYLEEQVLWTQHPVWVCIGNIKHYIRVVLLGQGDFYPKTFIIFALLFAARLLYCWVKKRRKAYLLYAVCALLLVLSPFYLVFYQGGGIVIRSQMTLPFAAAFFGAASAAFIARAAIGLRRGGRCLAGILTAVCLMLAVYQGNTSSRAVFSAYMTYENDKMTAEQLVERLQALDAVIPGQKVAMVGQHRPYLPEGAGMREEIVGYSFFEWDHDSPVGVTKRGAGLLTTLGFPVTPVSKEEYDRAVRFSRGMTCWPDKNSVQQFGDMIVIKFSD